MKDNYGIGGNAVWKEIKDFINVDVQGCTKTQQSDPTRPIQPTIKTEYLG